jgi:hypothetical protein
MRSNRLTCVYTAVFLGTILTVPLVAQDVRIDVSKRSTTIPKSCESVVPAMIEGTVDATALVKEAIFKGSGDMLADYTYVTNTVKREKDKKGRIKEETFTYEVFFPTLKSGMRTHGILVVTSHNGIAVPPDELEKERVRSAERVEKEEAKLAREAPTPVKSTSPARESAGTDGEGAAQTGTVMMPLGMYTRSGINREAFGSRRGGVTLAVMTFLKSCELTQARREEIDGRETLIFSFTPHPEVQFSDNEKYITQLKGEIWIDAKDRIVTRLIGWPTNAAASATGSFVPSSSERPPAVYVEMMLLPRQGIWFPHVVRINGADYPRLFDGITTDSTSTYSDYIRFSTEVKDVKVGTPNNER